MNVYAISNECICYINECVCYINEIVIQCYINECKFCIML